MPLAGILILLLLTGLLCAVLGVGAALIFPEFPEKIRVLAGFPPSEDISPIPTRMDITSAELTTQAMGRTPGSVPMIPTPAGTPELNLLFSDNFDTEINPAYWQTFGTWMYSKDKPVLLSAYKPGTKYDGNAFGGYSSGLVFPGTANLDNIAIEFDIAYGQKLEVLLAYKDEYNFKGFYIDNYRGNLDSFVFYADGKKQAIPQSQVGFSAGTTHVRIEIRGTSLAVYMNGQVTYDFKYLPESEAGAFGFASSECIDNFKIYQLP
jgi:hypothetical protein